MSADLLRALGGVASYRTMVRHCSRADLERAVAAGEILRVGRGRYTLPEISQAAAAAHGLNGVLSHTSAALGWGWALKTLPDRPHVTVPTKRKVAGAARRGVHLHRRDLLPEEVRDGRTSRDLTLEQCLRSLPFDEGLAVADSALRSGFLPGDLNAIGRDARGPGAAAIRAVARAADGRADNPFESVLRALAHSVPGLRVVPQVRIGPVRPDLVDEDLRVVLEADSFAWHGSRAALRRDAQRYNALTVAGWTVLRFAWEDVMFEPTSVQQTLAAVVDLAQRRR